MMGKKDETIALLADEIVQLKARYAESERRCDEFTVGMGLLNMNYQIEKGTAKVMASEIEQLRGWEREAKVCHGIMVEVRDIYRDVLGTNSNPATVDARERWQMKFGGCDPSIRRT